MEFRDLILEAGRLVGFENLEPDESGLYHLVAENLTITIEWVAEYELILMSAAVCKIPPERAGDAALYRMIVEANFQYRQTCGSTAALDPDSDYVYIFRYDRVFRWTPEDVVYLIGRVVEGANSVRSLIAEAGVPSEPPEDEPKFLLGSGFILA